MRTDSSGFFVAGGSLRSDTPSYVERTADGELFGALNAGEFCYVLTSRQMGKSSLMVRTVARLRDEDVRVAVLDLTALGQNLGTEQWYYGLLGRLGEQLEMEGELDAFWSANPRLGPCQRWMKALRDVVLPALGGATTDNRRPTAEVADRSAQNTASSIGGGGVPATRAQSVVVFIDEIDVVRSLPFSTDEFFAAIRECYNRRTDDPTFDRLTFCLLGVAAPTDLIRDTRMTPFNIGRRIELTDFSEEEARIFAVGLEVGDMGEPGRPEGVARALLRRVLRWTGGHPYLTQRLCQAVAADASIEGPAGVDRVCERLFLSHRAQETDDNLIFVRERLLRSENDLAALLQLYAQVRRRRVAGDDGNALCSALKLAGIARLAEGKRHKAKGARRVGVAGSPLFPFSFCLLPPTGTLRVRNRIYERVFDERWIAAQMPDAEVRRQRAAYRRGVVRATSIGAAMLAVVSGLALFGIGQARLAREQAVNLRRNLYAADVSLAYQLWQEGNVSRALALLETYRRPKYGEEDLRGFEWRYLWRLCRSQALVTFHGHTGAILGAMAFSPEGERLATGAEDSTVRIWDVSTGRPLAVFSYPSRVLALAWSVEGRALTTVTRDGMVGRRELKTGREEQLLRLAPIRVATLSHDGRLLGVQHGDNSRIACWDIAAGRRLFEYNRSTGYSSTLSFSNDGRFLAAPDGVNRVGEVWEARTGRRVYAFPGGSSRPISAAFSPDQKTLAIGGADGSIILWDLTTKRATAAWSGHLSSVMAVRFSADGATLATASVDHTIRLWKMTQPESIPRQVGLLQGHGGPVYVLRFAPGGRTLASAGMDGTALLWPAQPSQASDVLDARWLRGSSARSLPSLSPDLKFAIVSDSGGARTQLWDAASRRLVMTFPKGSLDAGFSDDGRLYATGEPVGDRLRLRLCYLFGCPQDRPRVTDAGIIPSGGVLCAAISSGARWVALGYKDGLVRLIDPATRQVTSVLAHAAAVRSVRFSPDGNRLATGSDDQSSALWNLATAGGRPPLLARFPKAGRYGAGIDFSPDGRILAVPSMEVVQLWSATSFRELATLRGHSDLIYAAAFSRDGQTLATGCRDGSVKLWNLTTRREVATLRGHYDHVIDIAFTLDGNTLVSAGLDQTVRLWRAAPRAEADSGARTPPSP
jgi:WD40 repeat protein